MTSSSSRRAIFEPFTFDLDTGELWRDEEAVHLAPQPTAALKLLVANADRLVSRDELRIAIWGPVSHLEFNAGLNFCIGQLRTALGDPGSESRYIQAVPKRGYRFVATIRSSKDESLATATTSSSNATTAIAVASARPNWRRWMPAAVAIAAMTVMSSAAASSSVRYGHRPTHSVAAAKALIRASTGLADAGPDELLDRIRLFDEAIANDPALADAYAGKAEALLIAGTYRARVPAAAYADAAAHAAHALTLAPSLASAHAAYGAALLYAERDWRGAEHHLRQAIALDPANVAAEQWYSGYLSARGQHAEAIRAAERAVALAPASASALTGLGTALFYAGRFGDAIAACDEAARLLPAFVPARRCASAAAAEAGDYHAAMARVAAAAAGNAAPSLAATLTSPTTWSSPETFWHGRLGRMERAVTASSCQCDEPLLAVPLAHLGDTARAFDALERGADRMSDHLLYVGVHPAFAALRTSPRFGDLLRRLGLRGA